ncbi:MAG: transposase [Acidobacteriota bacterium]|nr:transposase [Acidobacteriota bacterium]
MSLYRKLSRKPQLFLSVTGVNLHQFQTLLPQFERADDKFERRRKRKVVRTGQKRKRQIGGGAQFGNSLPDRLLMLLFYYRLYLTQELMTLLFKAEDKSVICRSIQLMRPVFEAVLPVPERTRQRILSLADKVQKRRTKRIDNVEEFREAYPELSFIIDGVEQPKRKPKAPRKRKGDNSGMKKRHTLKQLVISTPSGIIIDQSPSVGGRSHDFKVFKQDHAARGSANEFKDYRVTLYGDSGFDGMTDVGLPVEVRLIEKARRNHPLTREQKKLNRLRSSTRIEIEHTFSRRKKYRIAADIYRNRDEDYDQTMNIVSGLVNLRAYDRIFQRTGLQL